MASSSNHRRSDGYVDLTTDSSPVLGSRAIPGSAPTSQRRPSTQVAGNSPQETTNKRRRISGGGYTSTESGEAIEQLDLRDAEDQEGLNTILSKQREEQIRSQRASREDEPPKLTSVQCTICLDSPPENMTVTHCGHIFCFECLMQALRAGNKSQCPICRSVVKIDAQKRGYTLLELKLATRRSVDKGKAVEKRKT